MTCLMDILKTRRTSLDLILLKIRNMMGIIEVLLQWFMNTTEARSDTLITRDKSVSGNCIQNENISNKESAEELHKPIIRKFNKRIVHSTWGAGHTDRQSISKFYKGIRFLCVIDIYCLITLKDKRGITIINVFQKVLNESIRKPSKIWVDNGSEFYNRSMKSCLRKNDIEIYATHTERKTVAAERFNKIFKTKNINTWLQYQKMCILIN